MNVIRFHDENRGELEELGQGAEIFLNVRSKGSGDELAAQPTRSHDSLGYTTSFKKSEAGRQHHQEGLSHNEHVAPEATCHYLPGSPLSYSLIFHEPFLGKHLPSPQAA